MKKISSLFVVLFFATQMWAQQPGDTIKIKILKYGSTTRDTFIAFPNNNLTYEKIIMKYNMRCKNGLISNQALPNQGCGEWDYSCNTYIVDSTKIEAALYTQPSHVISSYTGTNFPYVSQPIFDFYNFSQTNVILNNIVSENQYTLGTGTTPVPNFLKTDERSGRSQILFTSAELLAAGITAGNIDGILLNVANAGAGANFFKLGIQQVVAPPVLNGNAPTLGGFTNVYNNSYTFATGSNRVQFHTSFAWNGTSHILLDLSFTNTNPVNPIVFNGSTGASVQAIYAKNNYALNLGSYGHAVLNPAMLGSISNEITVAFWAFGNAAAMPLNTVLMHGYGSNVNQRTFNLHLPWSDNNMYFDAGYAAGNYDRINKAAILSEQGGQWHHWAFTKNAISGDMKIYLDGALWHSGTGKNKAISILYLILGKDKDLLNNYKGKINELSIWNKELALADVQGWMNKPLVAAHPFYVNLLVYYKMNEGTGLTITDSKNNLTSTGVNLQWTYDRGSNLTRMFSESNIRPNVIFVNGVYAMTTNTLVRKDSVARLPNIVQQYSITSNATVTPMMDDAVVLTSATNLYEATPSKIYDGDTGFQTGTISVVPTGTITISTLNYFRRFPFYNEIMSFVTPYGKGLDMGINGKSWFYDVTDFTPLLKGNKRLVMSLGGEGQEQMDIDFWFIVGTPPRTVLQFNQLWQGAARAGGAAISTIISDARFNVQTVPILNTGQAFKMRSTITGHGAQGEFKQNGGLINHFFNIAGGGNEFTWQITQGCSMNPVFPQGGTWIYDREGWCPGQASLLKEFNITPFVTPGNTVTLDYNCSNPPNANGDYRFIVANQLVTYGAANHVSDASIIDVLAPSTKVLYSRANPICTQPLILIQNTGSSTLISIDLEFWINTPNVRETFTWTGSLGFMDTAFVRLPTGGLWNSGFLPNGNKFYAEIKKVNGGADQYVHNNKYASDFEVPIAITNSFSIVFKTNNNPLDNTYKLYNDLGFEVASGSLTAPNTVYTDPYEMNGCYTLKVEDFGRDGVQWWANTGQGVGYVKILDAYGATIKTFQPDFGGGFEFSFTTYNPLSVSKNKFGPALNLYPNPAHDKFVLQGEGIDGAAVTVKDVLGKTIDLLSKITDDKMELDTRQLVPGVYLVSVTIGNETVTKKVVVH